MVAFQEVDGVAAAARVFSIPARYALVAIDEDVVQRVGLAVSARGSPCSAMRM